MLHVFASSRWLYLPLMGGLFFFSHCFFIFSPSAASGSLCFHLFSSAPWTRPSASAVFDKLIKPLSIFTRLMASREIRFKHFWIRFKPASIRIPGLLPFKTFESYFHAQSYLVLSYHLIWSLKAVVLLGHIKGPASAPMHQGFITMGCETFYLTAMDGKNPGRKPKSC